MRLDPITGPGSPLNAAAASLSAHGFVEQEFRLTGRAARYRVANPMLDAQPIDEGHPFATRLLVRRPANLRRFNGCVVVEWLNVSTGQDIDFVCGATRELILREGYAWIGASVQRVGVECLVAWNPARYAGLSVAAPADDPHTGAALDPPLPSWGAAGGDVLCWDLWSQIGRVVREASATWLGSALTGPLIAAGESQAALRLSRYFNAMQPLHAVYDGYLLYDRGGPHPLRDDVAAKVISIGTDFFAELLGGSPAVDAANQRWWELAGASHVSLHEMNAYIDPQVLRDGVQRIDGRAASLTEVMLQTSTAPAPLWSRVSNGDLMKAALHALSRWVSDGSEPAVAPRLVLDAQGRLLRDAQGCTVGGVRHPDYQVPRAHNVGSSDAEPRLAGFHQDFTPQELKARYGTQAVYLAQLQAAVHSQVEQGFLLAPEARRIMEDARAVRFGA